jgi:tetratricopeptide (TPR) repeat protein
MKGIPGAAAALALALALPSCAPSSETERTPGTGLETREAAFGRGHRYYLSRQFDSASVWLRKAADMDRTYVDPLVDLGALCYDRGMTAKAGNDPAWRAEFEQSLRHYARAEELGARGSDLYERLSEVSAALDDREAFLTWAKKNAEAHPYDRQYFNLGLASFNAGDFQGAITVLKEAIEKFPSSLLSGSFYRQLGRAYMKVDRDQTAERVFVSGVQVVDRMIAGLERTATASAPGEDERRLLDDKIGMLLSLKKLHQTYGAKDKLEHVERELREAGYQK